MRLRYWKPVQTGIEQDDDATDVRRLARCRENEIVAEGIRLPCPVSPHLAARWAGQTIRIEDLTRLARQHTGDERMDRGRGPRRLGAAQRHP